MTNIIGGLTKVDSRNLPYGVVCKFRTYIDMNIVANKIVPVEIEKFSYFGTQNLYKICKLDNP
jgi:hypothetical protein